MGQVDIYIYILAAHRTHTHTLMAHDHIYPHGFYLIYAYNTFVYSHTHTLTRADTTVIYYYTCVFALAKFEPYTERERERDGKFE